MINFINKVCEQTKEKLKPDLIKYGKNYRAISESAILEVLNPLLKENRIAYMPVIKDYDLKIEKVKSGIDSSGFPVETLVFIATVKVDLQFYEQGSPAPAFIFEGVGMGIDSGDKAMGKALTAATKYALLKGFRLQYSDDPDAEASTDITSISASEETKPAQKTKNVSEKKAKSTKKESKPEEKASEGQMNFIKGLVVKCGLSDSEFKSLFGCLPYDDIPMSKAREIIDKLKEYLNDQIPF